MPKKRDRYCFNGDIRSRSYQEWQETLQTACSQEIRYTLAKLQGRKAGWIKIRRTQRSQFRTITPPKEYQVMQAVLIEQLIKRLEELENRNISNGLANSPSRRLEAHQKDSSLSQYKSNSNPDQRPKVSASEKLHNQRARHVS